MCRAATRKAPRTASLRSRGPMPLSGGVALTRSIRSSRVSRPRRTGQRRGDQRRLVVAAPPDPPAVQRHRRQQRVGRRVEMPRHEPRHRLGDAGPAAIFELQRDLARDLAISDRGAQPVISRRLGEAAAAFDLRARRHSRTATRSGRSRARRGRRARTSNRGRNGAAPRSPTPQPGQRGGSAKSRTGRTAARAKASGGMHGAQPSPGPVDSQAKPAHLAGGGPMAEWLRRGLQILARRFDSGSGLQSLQRQIYQAPSAIFSRRSSSASLGCFVAKLPVRTSPAGS